MPATHVLLGVLPSACLHALLSLLHCLFVERRPTVVLLNQTCMVSHPMVLETHDVQEIGGWASSAAPVSVLGAYEKQQIEAACLQNAGPGRFINMYKC